MIMMDTASESCTDAAKNIHTEPSSGEDHNKFAIASKGSQLERAFVPDHRP